MVTGPPILQGSDAKGFAALAPAIGGPAGQNARHHLIAQHEMVIKRGHDMQDHQAQQHPHQKGVNVAGGMRPAVALAAPATAR